jgi:hypothetical protein
MLVTATKWWPFRFSRNSTACISGRTAGNQTTPRVSYDCHNSKLIDDYGAPIPDIPRSIKTKPKKTDL